MKPFKEGAYDMYSLPMSKTKEYGDSRQGKATQAGLTRNWEKVLNPKMIGKDIDRIVLVDHSKTGQSPDGFREAVLEMARVAAPQNVQSLERIPMVLINIIDEARRQREGLPVSDPKTVPVLARIYPQGSNPLSGIIGAKQHARLTPEYPPSQWEKAIKDSWGNDEKAAADKLKEQIKRWNRVSQSSSGSHVDNSS